MKITREYLTKLIKEELQKEEFETRGDLEKAYNAAAEEYLNLLRKYKIIFDEDPLDPKAFVYSNVKPAKVRDPKFGFRNLKLWYDDKSDSIRVYTAGGGESDDPELNQAALEMMRAYKKLIKLKQQRKGLSSSI
jgi:hypothetical protein